MLFLLLVAACAVRSAYSVRLSRAFVASFLLFFDFGDVS